MAEQNRDLPGVSVIITTYNGRDVIGDTVQSILDQTYRDFEIIIVDDCSKDDTVDVIRSFDDPRIKIFVNDRNRGSFWGLTKGIQEARGKYIARTDQDDISYPQRFEKQYSFLESNPDIFLCGTLNDQYIDGKRDNEWNNPVNTPDELAFSAVFGNFCFIHSSFFFRKEEAIRKDIRYEQFRFAEDYHFILQAVTKARIARLPEVHVGYRLHPGQYSNWEPQEDELAENESMLRQYCHSNSVREEDEELIVANLRGQLSSDEDYDRLIDYVKSRASQFHLNYGKNGENRRCIQHVLRTCILAQKRNRSALRAYFRSGVFDRHELITTKKGRHFLIKALIQR